MIHLQQPSESQRFAHQQLTAPSSHLLYTANRVSMWSTPCIDSLSNTSSKTPISSDFDTRLSPSGELDFGIGAPLTYEPNTFRPGRFEKLANALENEFSLGFSTTDPTDPSARQPNSEDPSGSGKVASQPSSAFSAPECKFCPQLMRRSY